MDMFQRNFLSNDHSYYDDTQLFCYIIVHHGVSVAYMRLCCILSPVRGLIILSNWIGQILFKSNLTLNSIFMAMLVLMEFFVLKTREELGAFGVFGNYGEPYW